VCYVLRLACLLTPPMNKIAYHRKCVQCVCLYDVLVCLPNCLFTVCIYSSDFFLYRGEGRFYKSLFLPKFLANRPKKRVLKWTLMYLQFENFMDMQLLLGVPRSMLIIPDEVLPWLVMPGVYHCIMFVHYPARTF